MSGIEAKCVTCGNDFVITEREQEFLQKTFGKIYNPPKRCKVCRERRRNGQLEDEAAPKPAEVEVVAPKRRRSKQ